MCDVHLDVPRLSMVLDKIELEKDVIHTQQIAGTNAAQLNVASEHNSYNSNQFEKSVLL